MQLEDKICGVRLRHCEEAQRAGEDPRRTDEQGKKHSRQATQFLVVDGMLHAKATPEFAPRLIIPKALRAEILTVGHDFSLAGHFGAKKVYQRLRRTVFWPGMSRDVQT
jgi:hypothetical protein